MWKVIKKKYLQILTIVFLLLSLLIMTQSLNHLTLLMPSITILLKVAIGIQSYIRFSKKKYFDYLPPMNIEKFCITLYDSTEVSNIIFSLNQDKKDGPNSIPTKILKLLNKGISEQLAIVFNQSFSSGIFP